MSTVDSANPPQEFPDTVGARPTNPLAANFKPFIPASVQLPELTWPHLVVGTLLGMAFGASSLYLVLKPVKLLDRKKWVDCKDCPIKIRIVAGNEPILKAAPPSVIW